jgi:hypothetical protein
LISGAVGKFSNPRKKRIQKREVQESLSEKKNQDEIDFPPQVGEFQYQLWQVFSTYRITHKTTNVIF